MNDDLAQREYPKGVLVVEPIMNHDVMIHAAEREYPREACGVIIDDQAFEIRNTAHKGLDVFIMDSKQLRALCEERGMYDGVWHSHPQGETDPSEDDLSLHPPGKRLLIVAGGKVYDHGRPGS